MVMFSTDRSRPVEEQALPPGQPWVVPSTQAEILEHFVGWGPRVTNMMAVILPTQEYYKIRLTIHHFSQNIKNPSKWFLHCLIPPLSTYVRGSIVLLGDAVRRGPHHNTPHENTYMNNSH